MFLFFTQVKFDISGRELVIPLSDYQHDGDDDEGYAHEVVQRMLAAKDEGLVSDKAYHELTMALLEKVRNHVPPLSAFKQERRSKKKGNQSNSNPGGKLSFREHDHSYPIYWHLLSKPYHQKLR